LFETVTLDDHAPVLITDTAEKPGGGMERERLLRADFPARETHAAN
jgi:hypothetical protein